ncbi:hypothetical protein QA942_32645 [Streptomyces sp. B21-106]
MPPSHGRSTSPPDRSGLVQSGHPEQTPHGSLAGDRLVPSGDGDGAARQ